ncbi:hypothetical protein FUAX_35880 [Fulvitalea axinellae]|uniref:Por secretion system C-terminal sorting domain-containing protein n=1 Tax=Fulvitalea axinellae TaxID=1182444 RepID=A0AAU9DDA8_9BACT|nr:hypothetical protein FUAX_35880 [Fulvitalea axinellae]
MIRTLRILGLCLWLSIALNVATHGQWQTSIPTDNDRSMIKEAKPNMSPWSNILVRDLEIFKEESGQDMEPFFQQYALRKQSDNPTIANTFIGAFIYVDPTVASQSAVSDLGGEVRIISDTLWSVQISLERFPELSSLPGMEYIQADFHVLPRLDFARKASNVDQVQNGEGLSRNYTGEGVIVGVLDFGFDYTHPTFRDNRGNLRISRVWNMEDSKGTPPSGFNYGTELVGAEDILKAKFSSTGSSHGTHVAGIAAGSGMGLARYKGVGLASEIVLVQLGGSSTSVTDGVAYIFEYAEKAGKPAVINMSLGSEFGPRDGTSTTDRIFDQLSGAGKLLVGAAGNEGNKPMHIRKEFTQEDDKLNTLMFFEQTGANYGYGFSDIWGQPGQDLALAVKIFNESGDLLAHTPRIDLAVTNELDTVINIGTNQIEIEISGEQASKLNDKAHFVAWVVNFSPDLYISLELSATPGQVDLWNGGNGRGATFSNQVASGTSLPGFSAGDTDITIGEIGGTSNSIITVGAYSTKNGYFNLQGQWISRSFNTGPLAAFSSHGPTADGRLKPEISAPGNVVVSSVNSFDTSYGPDNSTVVANVREGEKTWYFAALQGTSMASPMTAGIMALWLQAKPDLSPEQAKTLMRMYPTQDMFTGMIPETGSNYWGWGKIDALRPLQVIESGIFTGGKILGTANDYQIIAYPNPSYGTVNIALESATEVSYSLITPEGKTIVSGASNGISTERKFSINLEHIAKGVYTLSVTTNQGTKNTRLILR